MANQADRATGTGEAQPSDAERRTAWRRPLEHFAERSLLGLLLVLAAGIGFGVLLLLVRGKWGPLNDLDHGAAAELNEFVSQSSSAVTILQAVTDIGGRPLMLWLVSVAVVGLLIRRQPRLACYLVVTGVGALLLDPSLKALVGRLRPVVDLPVASAPGNSFPSGHALGSVVAYGAVLLVFLPAMSRRWRRVAIGVFAILVLVVGFTRVALGVHFITDVLGGWLLGLAWLGVTAYAFRLWQREEGKPAPRLTEGLDPEAAPDLALAPDERRLLPHPWAGAAEIVTGWVLVFGALYGFGMLVSYHAGGTFVESMDREVPLWFAEHRTAGLDDFSWWWSKFGDTHAILLVSLVFCPLMVAVWRRWRPVLFIALVMFGELTLFLASARAVDRPRPPVENLDGQMPTASFPSGHIAATLCLYTAIAVLVLARTKAWWWRVPVVALAVILPIGVAVSRMYRGMHHPSDFAGAIVLTVLWVGLLYWVVKPNADVRGDPAVGDGGNRPLSIPTQDLDGDGLTNRDDPRPLVRAGNRTGKR